MSEEKTTKKDSVQTAEKAAKQSSESQPAAKPKASPQTTAKQSSERSSQNADSDFVAVLLIRGLVNVKHEIRDTLQMLNLSVKNSVVILKNDKVTQGMLKKCKDYITYGPITKETIKELKEKRPTKNKTHNLHPPRGGFERKGIKKPTNKGGALGPRKEMDTIIKKML